ncbi:MAG: hypothetical protein ACREOZ_00340, partial [Gloeomargaritales cyanobacterium]
YVLADSLSRDFHCSPDQLTNLLFTHAADHIPKGFAIINLPTEIDSWLTSVLQLQQESMQS